MRLARRPERRPATSASQACGSDIRSSQNRVTLFNQIAAHNRAQVVREHARHRRQIADVPVITRNRLRMASVIE
jgi:hypothetical protein